MDWARANGYTVFTHDLDLGSLLAATQANGPSVIQVRTQDVLPSHLSGMVVRVLSQYKSAIESGVLISIDEAGSRVRLLPRFLRRIERARQSIRAGHGVRLEDVAE